MGRLDLAGVRRQIEIEEQQGKLIRALNTDYRHAEGAFTTPQAVAIERENLALAEEGKNEARPIASSLRVWAWAAMKGLYTDQRNAAQVTLTSRD
jgi:hypothetical protein